MFRKLTYTVLLFLAFCAVFERQAKAQEYPWSLQYVTNMQTINPAYVGIWDKASLMVSTKANWIGIGGAPLAQYATYSTAIKDLRSGVGINIQRLNNGLEKRIFLTGDYSYRLRLDMTHYLQMGLRAGIVNYDNNLNNYQPYPDYIPDPNASTDVSQHNMTTFGIGAVYFSENFYLSISAPQIPGFTLTANRNGNVSTTPNLNTIYGSCGYVFVVSEWVHLRPNLMVAQTIGKPMYFDVAGLVTLHSRLQFGLNIRSTGSLCISGQFTFSNNMRIGYAADYTVTSDIRRFQLGTHEILIAYDFNIYKRKYTKPSYF